MYLNIIKHFFSQTLTLGVLALWLIGFPCTVAAIRNRVLMTGRTKKKYHRHGRDDYYRNYYCCYRLDTWSRHGPFLSPAGQTRIKDTDFGANPLVRHSLSYLLLVLSPHRILARVLERLPLPPSPRTQRRATIYAHNIYQQIP